MRSEFPDESLDNMVKVKNFFSVIPAKAGIQYLHKILDAGSVIPDLIRDRHDKFGIFFTKRI
ncbi:MAG: hypothetical protein AB1Z29_05830 [Desulfobacterales bacterium]